MLIQNKVSNYSFRYYPLIFTNLKLSSFYHSNDVGFVWKDYTKVKDYFIVLSNYVDTLFVIKTDK